MYLVKYWDSGDLSQEPDEILLIENYFIDEFEDTQATKVCKIIKQFDDNDLTHINFQIRIHKGYFLGDEEEIEIIPIDSKIVKALYGDL